MSICVVCEKSIDEYNWKKIKTEYGKMLNQVDVQGEESLTEIQQTIYANKVHVECISTLININ